MVSFSLKAPLCSQAALSGHQLLLLGFSGLLSAVQSGRLGLQSGLVF